HTPRNRYVRFVFGVAAASRNTRFQATRYGLTWAGLAPADRASFAWRLPSFDHLVSASQNAEFVHTKRLMHRSKRDGHSITSSASNCIELGTTRPSALAVFRLITSSNFVGCRTGRSAGLVPLRMRPT